MNTAAPDELLKVYVLLAEQVDTTLASSEIEELRRRPRRRRAISRMQEVAERTQGPLVAGLESLRASGEVGEIRRLWVANLLIAEVTPGVVWSLAVDPAVGYLHLVRPYEPGEATDDLPAKPIVQSLGGDIEPNLELINAPAVWAEGYEGQGIVVANIDTGQDEEHPDLANHIWRNIDEVANGLDDDGNGYVDDLIGWDFEQGDNDPTPSGPFDSSHGTNTAGIVVGDGTQGRQTGVAPKGTVMILKACGEEWEMEAIEYAIDNGADLITSSCSYKYPFTPAYAVWRTISENERLVGVVHANSIGNQGEQLGTYPIPYNISAPANTPSAWLDPAQMIVGGLGGVIATGGVEVDLSQYEPSGRGPAAWEDITIDHPGQLPIPPEFWDYPWDNGALQGLLKPEIVMPTNVWTTEVTTGYGLFGGTSAATPHTGGAMALLLSAAPNATPEDISRALQTYTLDLGPGGKDNDYGSGLPDLLAAVESIWPDVTPVLEPYGQTISAGGSVALDLQLVNNTAVSQDVMVRIDVSAGGASRTLAGPAQITLAADSSLIQAVSLPMPPGATGRVIEITLVVEDMSGVEIASTDVEAYISDVN